MLISYGKNLKGRQNVVQHVLTTFFFSLKKLSLFTNEKN